jgi:hypothetical protein
VATNITAAEVSAAIVVFLNVAVVIVGIRYGLARVFHYSLENSELVVRIFRVPIYRVPLSDIDRAEVVPFGSLVLFSRSFRPDLFLSQKYCGYRPRVVAVTRRTGWLKRIVISPESPELFAGSLFPDRSEGH